MKLKIMNWNVLHGFHELHYPFKLEVNRLKSAKQIIRKENPDILALTEACYGGANPFGISFDYKGIFGFPYFYFAKWGDFEWGNAILSKYPIQGCCKKFLDRTFLQCKIDLENKFLDIDVVHPSPSSSEHSKSKALRNLILKKSTPYILTGDFNSISPQDIYSYRSLIEGYDNLMGTYKSKVYIKELLKRRAIMSILGNGLVDTFKKCNSNFSYSVPTDMLSIDKRTALRADYIFCSHDIKILDAGIIKNAVSEKASDHYPTYAYLSV